MVGNVASTGSSRALFRRRMALSAVMGFASGLPILLTVTVLQAWLVTEGIGLTTIGLLALIAIPYSIKFLWAPFLDRIDPINLGRRRGWLLITQLALAAGIAALAMQDPALSIASIAGIALIVTFFSATQDIVIDAYRRETLNDDEQALGASLYVYGYRAGTLVSSAGGLILADTVGFPTVYGLMAAVMLLMAFISWIAPEPILESQNVTGLKAAYAAPFKDLITRNESLTTATILLSFVALYNFGLQVSGHLLVPYYLFLGYTNTNIGAVSAVFGTGAFLLGVLAGGALQLRIGLYRTMLIVGVLQFFAVLSPLPLQVTQSLWALAGVMGIVSVVSGMGITALMAFIATMTNRRFTATQFALLTAIAALPRTGFATVTGWLATQVGWTGFFCICAAAALPAFIMLISCRRIFTR